jgi:hypothetical protein
MNKEVAKNICTQMVEDVEGLCECPRYNEKDKTCIGCRELAIKTILEENIKLQQRIDKSIEYINNSGWLEEDCFYNFKELEQVQELLEILRGGENNR